jgi:NADPH2:quinone reductase
MDTSSSEDHYAPLGIDATYRALVLTGKGGLDQLEERNLPRVEPKPGELRILVHGAGAGATDLLMRAGKYIYQPRFPFTVGYEVVGEVDALGEGVADFAIGDRVCALTLHGAQAEYLVRDASEFVKVPNGLDSADVIALILNYVTAYQMIHRCTSLRAGQTALVTGATGGVGSALLELLRELSVRTIGCAAPDRFALVRELGGEPVEARGEGLAGRVRAIVGAGVDVAFDGLGGTGTRICLRATRRGGRVVGYGFVAATRNGKPSALRMLQGMWWIFLGALLLLRRSTLYGLTERYRKDKSSFKADLKQLFELLERRRIQPKIAARLPLLAGVQAQRMLEEGGVVGKIVLLRDA